MEGRFGRKNKRKVEQIGYRRETFNQTDVQIRESA